MEYIIQTQNLTKKYKNDTVVNNLNLKIKEGEIYGLLGQNGAGKTTTMCLLTNLSEKTSGQIRIFGKNPQENIDIYKKIGVIIETPGFYENLTGFENLKYFSKIQGNYNKEKVEHALNTMGLTNNSGFPVVGS